MEVRKVNIDILRNFWKKELERKVKRSESNFGCVVSKEGGVVADITVSTIFSTDRVKKVKELKFLIENGFYKLDSRAIAKNIIAELLND